MGLTRSGAELLLEAKGKGCSFERTATLGRQFLHIYPSDIARLCGDTDGGDFTFGGFADDFFKRAVGVEKLEAIDASDYEGCHKVHDMNLPLGDDVEGVYDAVIDGGSLEHIFNFPVAISNCMRMVKVGGSLFVLTMANNHCGHGFYQFSPELFYRVLCEKNGFEVEKMVLCEHPFPQNSLSPVETTYEVADPEAVRSRVLLVSKRPAMLLIWAKKTSEVVPFENGFPQQSDYVARWENESERKGTSGGLKTKIKAMVPSGIWNLMKGKKQLRHASTQNESFYKRTK